MEMDWSSALSELQHSDVLISDLINLFDSEDEDENKQAIILLNKSISQLCQISQVTKGIFVMLLSLAVKYQIDTRKLTKNMDLVTRDDVQFEIKNLTR